jgi:hypothetical protein
MILMIATNVLLFAWLNHWLSDKDNTNAYFYKIYLAILAASLISIGVHAFMEFNSDFFNELHRMMIRNLLTAPMTYF